MYAWVMFFLIVALLVAIVGMVSGSGLAWTVVGVLLILALWAGLFGGI